MDTTTSTGRSKKKTVCLVGATLTFAAYTIYNLLPKLLPPTFESSPPIYFSNSKAFYWIWNEFEMKGPNVISKLLVEANIHPPKEDEDEYLVPLTEADFEYHSLKMKKNRIFLQSLVNLHIKTISDGKKICGQCGRGWVNCSKGQEPTPVGTYDGYEEGSYFGEKLSHVLQDGALLSLKIISVGSDFKQRLQCPRESLNPSHVFDIQTITKVNLTNQRGLTDKSHSDGNKIHNKQHNFDDLAKLSFCNVAQIPLTVNQDFKEIGSTKLFFIPLQYKRKTSSWLTWAYTILTVPIRFFSPLPSSSALVSNRCFHTVNSLPYNKFTKYNTLPETFSSIVFCH